MDPGTDQNVVGIQFQIATGPQWTFDPGPLPGSNPNQVFYVDKASLLDGAPDFSNIVPDFLSSTVTFNPGVNYLSLLFEGVYVRGGSFIVAMGPQNIFFTGPALPPTLFTEGDNHVDFTALTSDQ